MDKVPNELVGLIFAELGSNVDDYVCRTTLANLRLICKRFAITAAPFLFETIPLWFSKDSFKRSEEASGHRDM